jgi:mycothiol system anti-sigma-R factor
MQCKEVETRLWEYLDGELAPEEAQAVARHVKRCARCHPAYCCDRALLALLARQRAMGSAPPSLWLRVQVWRAAGR